MEDNSKITLNLKQKYNIDENKKIILYAPTWIHKNQKVDKNEEEHKNQKIDKNREADKNQKLTKIQKSRKITKLTKIEKITKIKKLTKLTKNSVTLRKLL